MPSGNRGALLPVMRKNEAQVLRLNLRTLVGTLIGELVFQYFMQQTLLHLILQTFWVMLRWERLLTDYLSNHLRGCSALPTNWASQRESSQRRAREGPSKIWSSSCCLSGNGGAQPTQSNHWHYWLWAVDTTLKHCDWTPPVCFDVLQSFFTVWKSHSIICLLHNWRLSGKRDNCFRWPKKVKGQKSIFIFKQTFKAEV